MPTYEYRCSKCGYTFEVFQSMLDEPIKYTHNPDCPFGKKKCRVERMIGAGAGIIFKGSGFYETDYRSKEYKDKAKMESKPIDTGSKDSGTKKPSSEVKSAKSSKESKD
ncbi:MAG: FmdB family zinc ribbon protein [bacterium]